MDDLISRQAALDTFGLSEKSRKYGGDHSGYDTIMLYEVQDALEALPSAQLEIIRCGECRWFQCNMRMDGYLPKGVGEFECRHWCGYCDPVDFCSHAERKTDE